MPPLRSRRHHVTGARQFYKHALRMDEMPKLLDDDVALASVHNRNPEFSVGSADAPAIVWLVFPDKSSDVGHYITSINSHIFDPYGSRKGLPHPQTMLPPMNGPVTLSTINYEGQPNPEVNTCGEWAALRANNHHLSDSQFDNKFGHFNNRDVGEWAYELVKGREQKRAEAAEQLEINKAQIEANEPEPAGAGGNAPEESSDPDPNPQPAVSDPAMKPTASSFFRNV